MMGKPKIRFKGYNEDWEQRKLGEVLKERTKRAQGGEELLSVTIANGVIRQADSEKRNIASEDKSNYKIVRKGDIPYNSMRMWQGAVGNSEYDGIVSPAYTVLVPTDEANAKFFMEYFKKENSLQLFQRWSQGLTSDTWNLKYPTLSSMRFSMPSIEEQNRIASYFEQLDHLITLHQHKCDEMKKLKKCMLQKMFPQNGKKVPEIRFEGFTNDWEQRKLGDVLSLLKDGTHGTHRDAESGPLLLSAKNIKNGTVQWDESDRRISEDEYNIIHSNFRLQKGDVLLTIVGSIGEVAILSQSEGVTFQRSVAFLRPSDEICSEFLYSEIQGQKFQKELNDRKSTSAQPGMYLGDLGAIPIEFPTSDEEQMQIGSYFSTIDHLITLHQHKCDELQNLKKYMLQNMFV